MAEVSASSATSRATAAAGAPAAVGEVVRLVKRALSLDSTSVRADWTSAFIVGLCSLDNSSRVEMNGSSSEGRSRGLEYLR